MASIGQVDRALGHEHVLPEIAEAAGPVRALLQRDQLVGEPRLVPSGGERDAHLRLVELRRRSTRGTAGRRRTRRDPRRPTSAGRSAGAETTPTTGPWSTWVRAIRVAHTGMPRTKLEVPSIGSITQRHGESALPTRPCSSPNKPSSGRSGDDLGGDRRLGLAIGLGHLGAVGLPVEAERSLLVVRQRDGVGDVGQFEAERQVRGEVAVASGDVIAGIRAAASPAARQCLRRPRRRGSSASRRPAMPRSWAAPAAASG